MTRSLPPLTWLRTFEAAARHLSFTAAAAEIGMTQSAVSQQVKALETRLQTRLFVRLPRGLALTDDGRKLLPQIGTALEALASATRAVDRAHGEDTLTIAASISVIQWLISPHLATFTARHPQVNIRLQSTIWPDEFSSIRADVEIRFGSKDQVGKDAVPLAEDRLIAVRARDSRLRVGAAPLIGAVGVSSGWRDWGEAAGIGALRPSLFADSYGMAMQLARDGNGIALVSACLAAHAIKTRLLEQVGETSIPARESYFVAADPDRPASRAFRDWILDLAQAT